MRERSQARELLMQMLYQMHIQNDFSDTIKERFMKENELSGNSAAYFSEVFNHVVNNLSEIDTMIDEAGQNWKLDIMSKVEVAILRLSIAEMLYVDSIPDSVSINEAVDIAKKFGGKNSGKFVNGILGKVSRGKNE